jgi:hypothetical protein
MNEFEDSLNVSATLRAHQYQLFTNQYQDVQWICYHTWEPIVYDLAFAHETAHESKAARVYFTRKFYFWYWPCSEAEGLWHSSDLLVLCLEADTCSSIWVSFLNKLIKTRKLTTLQVSFQYLHMVSCCAKIILL